MKKLLSLALVFIMLFSVAGCATPVKVEDLEIPTYKDEKEMVLRVDLPPNMSDREQMELYKECGFNTIPLTEDFFSAADVDPYMDALAKYEEELAKWNGDEDTKPTEPDKPKYIQALELCEELDIDIFIRPHHNPYVSGTPEKVINDPNYFEKFFSKLDFHDYPAVKGFMIVDEPTWGQVTDLINRYLPWFNEYYGDGNYEMFANLLGSGSTVWKDKYSQTKTYADFMNHYHDEFLDKVNSKNKTISYDAYVLCNDGTSNFVADRYLQGLLSMRQYADKYNAEFGAYVQCFTGYSNLRDPASLADFAYQIYTYLAFGVDRLSFYGYRDYPPESHLMEGGTPRAKWYWVQQMNTVIKKLDGLLGNFKWEGVYTNVGTGSFFETSNMFENIKKDALKSLKGISEVKSKYDTIVTQFVDGTGRNAYFLVNQEEPSLEKTNKASLKFEKADGVMYYRNGDPVIATLENGTFNIELEPGEGVFIIPLYKK